MKQPVLIVINSLHSGGAEKSCIELVRQLAPTHDIEVLALVIGGPAELELRALGIAVTILSADGLVATVRSVLHLARVLRRKQPRIVITFLYLADLVGGCLTRLLLPRARIYWNVRNNVLTRRQVGAASFLACRLNAVLSRFVPHTIVYCSSIAREQHEAVGYHCADSAVVENSLAAVPFGFSAAKRAAGRGQRYANEFVFLFVGRFDPVKRVDIYVQAGGHVARELGAAVRFLLAGRGMEPGNAELAQQIATTSGADRFELLGFVSDPQQLYSVADCLVVTSESEGSPNVVYEAMATALDVIIFGTVGAEAIQGEGVHQCASRDLRELTDAMQRAALQGVTSAEQRQVRALNRSQSQEHPLVSYYRGALSCG